MVNRALSSNPPAGTFHITTHASDWLWTVFAIMLLSLLISLFWTALGRHRNRIPYQIPIVVLTVSSIAYFSMASDLGFAVISNRHGTRQVWYVRYIQWYRLFAHSLRYPFRVGQNVRSGYWGLGAYVGFIWTLYPICWGLSEGSNTISPTSEMVFYGILDIMAGPLFLFFYMLRVSTLQSADLGAASLSAANRGEVEPKGPAPGTAAPAPAAPQAPAGGVA
ncbi:hypothetical protein PISMIDRAFT_28737 [Pisolithus microcarpus 441]|uniref:Opsin n=1 Tax=Pisolithus microcarpus 441 TaxID=765257 RepID=A0A0C9YLF5_9AGAM|nr:hypothetical protein PISMIDRAFT_28737 [Pisolithus microcarpus 441]